MQNRNLIILVVAICLISGLAGARPIEKACRILSYAASFYAPDSNNYSAATMKFGNEYLIDNAGRSYFK